MNYRREIDGLRAMAVLPVLFYHAGYRVFSGGFVGVDVFFVISGYLITNILLQEFDQGKFSASQFYERRVRRILPALIFVMTVCMVVSYVDMTPWQFKVFSASFGTAILGVSNMFFLSQISYFSPISNLQPLLHTWSLSVEEQYYLIFPIILARVHSRNRSLLPIVIFVLIVFSFSIAEFGRQIGPERNYFFTLSRLWEIGVGSLCAFSRISGSRRFLNGMSLIGIALILFSIFYYDGNTRFPGVFTLAPVLGAALIILFAREHTWAAWLLSTRPFVGLGLISYSTYLWHQPIFAFARLRSVTEPSGFEMFALVLVTLILAWGTWRFVECPMRRRKSILFPTRRSLFAVVCATCVVFFAVGLAGYLSDGLEWRLSADQRAMLQYKDYPHHMRKEVDHCFLGEKQSYADFSEVCWVEGEGLILGDSHADALASAISADEKIGKLTASGCPPSIGFDAPGRPNCAAINRFRFDLVLRGRWPIVLLDANWLLYWGEPDFEAGLRAAVKRVVDSGSLPIIVGGTPQFKPSLPELILNEHADIDIDSRVITDLAEIRKINTQLRNLASETKAIFWDPMPIVCRESECSAFVPLREGDIPVKGLALLSWDYGHLTFSGASFVGSALGRDLNLRWWSDASTVFDGGDLAER